VEATAREVILAIRRDRRSDAETSGWKEKVAALDGVHLFDSPSPLRAMAWVTPTGLAALHSLFGSLLLIENPINHLPLSPPT
jgi:hypothetical protein